MKKVLWISLFIPYDSVRHAGGKIHNYYLKALHATGEFNVKLLTFATQEDIEKHDLDIYGIDHDIICFDNTVINYVKRRILNLESSFNPFNRYGRALANYDILSMKKLINEKKEKGFEPEIIILQWTQMIFLLPFIKKMFPDVPVVAIEEDVSYLSYYRKMYNYSNRFLRYISKISYKKVKKLELEVLNNADIVITNNFKDEKLLISDGIQERKIFVWTPYFQNFFNLDREEANNIILFYGGMSRQENYLSAIWFIKKVMPLLKDIDIEFHIVGSNPHKSLFQYENKRVKIVGFVENIEDYLKNSLCLVAPLVLGAGIKIKILEALSAGLPVLTNDIGIEGIEAENEKEYFFCKQQSEYNKIIHELYYNKMLINNISISAKKFINNNFNIEESKKKFISIINNIDLKM